MKTNKSSAILLVDVGNSYLKWARLVEGELSDFGQSAHNSVSLPEGAITAWCLEPATRIFISNVAGQVLEAAMAQWFEAQWQLRPAFIAIDNLADYGLQTQYNDPHCLGIDRILVLIAARQWAPVCVIDCGTAVTIDVLSQQNIHLGGAIFPGLTLMRDALFGKASGVRRGVKSTNAQPGLGFLGQDTAHCIEQGASAAVAGGIAHYMDDIAQNLGEYRRIMTGGDAIVIQSMLKDGYHVVPNLVLRGLQIVAYQNQ